MEKKAAFCVLKALIAAYIMTGILLVALSFALCMLGLSENATELGVILIYLLSCATGGFFAGKCMETRRLLWGIVLGFLYVLVLVIVSLIARGGLDGVVHGNRHGCFCVLQEGRLGHFCRD